MLLMETVTVPESVPFLGETVTQFCLVAAVQVRVPLPELLTEYWVLEGLNGPP